MCKQKVLPKNLTRYGVCYTYTILTARLYMYGRNSMKGNFKKKRKKTFLRFFKKGTCSSLKICKIFALHDRVVIHLFDSSYFPFQTLWRLRNSQKWPNCWCSRRFHRRSGRETRASKSWFKWHKLTVGFLYEAERCLRQSSAY